MVTLQHIIAKYSNVKHNKDNYAVGGGLDAGKFASNRHEDARSDAGKLTLGEATALFKRATKLESATVKSIIKSALPDMEWHHAGKLPKSFGGGMKKTYFLNAEEIVTIANNWESYKRKFEEIEIAEQAEYDRKLTTEVIGYYYEWGYDYSGAYGKKRNHKVVHTYRGAEMGAPKNFSPCTEEEFFGFKLIEGRKYYGWDEPSTSDITPITEERYSEIIQQNRLSAASNK